VPNGLTYWVTTVGNDVWIGRGTFIKGRVQIGDGAVIAAHAIVTKHVAPYAVVGENSAKLIRYRFDEAMIVRLLATRWWGDEPAWMAEIDFRDVPAALAYLETHQSALPKLNPKCLVFGPRSACWTTTRPPDRAAQLLRALSRVLRMVTGRAFHAATRRSSLRSG
jgi:hypothetical protein